MIELGSYLLQSL